MSRTHHHGDRKKQHLYGAKWRWMSTPGWYHHCFHTKPRRAQERQAIYRAVTNPDEDVIFPLDHKPHWYYW